MHGLFLLGSRHPERRPHGDTGSWVCRARNDFRCRQKWPRIFVSLVFVPMSGFTAICWADQTAWITACCFILPTCLLIVRNVTGKLLKVYLRKMQDCKMNKTQRNFMVDLAYDIVGSFIYCTGVYTFAKESGFSIGGFSGLGLIINHLTHLPVGILTLFSIFPLLFSAGSAWKTLSFAKKPEDDSHPDRHHGFCNAAPPRLQRKSAACFPVHRNPDGRQPGSHLYAGLLDQRHGFP